MRSGHAIWRLEGGLAVLHFIQCAGWALWVLPAGRWGGRLSGVWLHPGRYQRLRGLQGFFVCQGDAQGFLPARRAVQQLHAGLGHAEGAGSPVDERGVGLAVHGWGGQAHAQGRAMNAMISYPNTTK